MIKFWHGLFATYCTLRPHNAGFWQSQEAYVLGTFLLNHTGQQNKKTTSRVYCLTRVQLVTGDDDDNWVTEKQNQGGKVAEDGTQSKRESSSSFCLPKVYPVVYTPRWAAAPRAERVTLWSKMNMWHIWLVSERERGPLRLAAGGSPMRPVLFWCTGSGKGYRLLSWSPQNTDTHTQTHTSTPL